MLYKIAKESWDAARETLVQKIHPHYSKLKLDFMICDKEDLNVTQYFNILTRYWQHLDMFEIYSWKCTNDSTLYKKIVEQKRTFKLLVGLNKDLDEVRRRIMAIKPWPTIQEAFSEVQREERRRKLMMIGDSSPTPTMEGPALYTHISSQNQGKKLKKGRPWCEHCKKPGHTKETCWKIHGKLADWKPNHAKNDQESYANVAARSNDANFVETSPFTKEQLDALQKLFGQISIPSEATPTTSHQHTSMLLSSPPLLKKIRKSEPWIVDPGASDHMTGDISIFQHYKLNQGVSTVQIADSSISKVAGIGNIQLTEDLILSPVLHVPNLDCNLISISKVTRDLNCVTKFYPNLCEFQAMDLRKVIGNAELCGGLYLLKESTSLHPKYFTSLL